jgi:hypothetical protein
MRVMMSMAVMAGVMMTTVMTAMVATVMTSVVTAVMPTMMSAVMTTVMASVATVAFRGHGDRQRESCGDRCQDSEVLNQSAHIASLRIFSWPFKRCGFLLGSFWGSSWRHSPPFPESSFSPMTPVRMRAMQSSRIGAAE